MEVFFLDLDQKHLLKTRSDLPYAITVWVRSFDLGHKPFYQIACLIMHIILPIELLYKV